MDNKPKMYQNRVSKEFHNNRDVFMSSNKDNNDINNKEINIVNDINDIRKKINDIINSNSFIYQTRVHIVIGSDIISRKIIGIFNNNLVTIDNEYIPLENIKDIYK